LPNGGGDYPFAPKKGKDVEGRDLPRKKKKGLMLSNDRKGWKKQEKASNLSPRIRSSTEPKEPSLSTKKLGRGVTLGASVEDHRVSRR